MDEGCFPIHFLLSSSFAVCECLNFMEWKKRWMSIQWYYHFFCLLIRFNILYEWFKLIFMTFTYFFSFYFRLTVFVVVVVVGYILLLFASVTLFRFQVWNDVILMYMKILYIYQIVIFCNMIHYGITYYHIKEGIIITNTNRCVTVIYKFSRKSLLIDLLFHSDTIKEITDLL